MIQGIGIDVVEISRIEDLVKKYGSHFVEKVFTKSEIEYCSTMARPAVHYAGRWAAKEAFYKALPQSCQRLAGFKSMEVPHHAKQKPEICVCDEKLAQALAVEDVASMHLSISHEKTVCIAFVIIERHFHL